MEEPYLEKPSQEGEGKGGLRCLASRGGRTHGSVLVAAIHPVPSTSYTLRWWCADVEGGPLDGELKSMEGDLKEVEEVEDLHQEAVGSHELEEHHWENQE